MIYPVEYVFQKTEDLNLSVFNIITEMNESKILTKHGIMINACVSAKILPPPPKKKIMCSKIILFGMRLHVLVKRKFYSGFSNYI